MLNQERMGEARKPAIPATADLGLLSTYPALMRRRAWLIFGCILLLGAALTLSVYLQTARVTDVTMRLVTADVPALPAISDLKLALVAQKTLLYEYYATKDRETFLHEFAANEQLIRAGTARLEEILTGRPELSAINSECAALLANAAQLDRTLADPRTDWDYARELLAEISRRSAAINAELDRLAIAVRATVSASAGQTHKLVSETTLLVLVFSAGIVILALVIGYYVTTSLVGAWQRRRLAAFPERNPSPVISLSLDGALLYANPCAQAMALELRSDGDVRKALLPADLDARLETLKQSDGGHARWEYGSGDRVLGCGIHLLRDLELIHVYISDITDRVESARRLQHAAYHDALTDLPNRRQFMEDAQRAFAGRLDAAGAGAALLINLDRFQLITETLGHAASDAVLQAVAGRLNEAAHMKIDHALCGCLTVYRFESDVFAVLLCGARQSLYGCATQLAEAVQQAFETPFPVQGREIFLTASIGIALYPDDAPDPATALKHADIAVQQVKRNGGHGSMRFCAELATAASERLELGHALQRAVARNELTLVYQPQLNIGNGCIAGVEALVRWQHPSLGTVSPARFIPIAEETKAIIGIGEWVLRTACGQCREWHRAGMPFTVGVNISARQFVDAGFPRLVAGILEETGLPPGQLELEITETAAMRDVELTARVLSALSEMGVRVAIDDFGTGYSSLNYLKRFAIDKLKIDQSFIRHVTADGDDAAIVQAIVELAHKLGLRVIAEGVETDAHLNLLRSYGCDEAQGYLISRPLPLPDLENFIARQRRTALPA
jgi:diguanylate cyclase (GGDEF)-like protein